MINITKEEINKQFKRTVSLILMCAVGTVSIASAGAFSRKVDINVDNNTISTITVNSDTGKILNQVGVKVSENDTVNRYEEIDGTIKLDVKRAFNVTVIKGDESVILQKVCGKVSEAIDESGIKTDANDDINVPLDADLEPNMEIAIRERIKLKINADGESNEVLVPIGSVSNALEYLNFPFSSEDIINVDVFSNVYEGMEIVINRITQRESVKMENIPFKSIVKKTNLLTNGTKKVTVQGKNGQKEITVKETLMDGNVVKSEEIRSEIISEPIDEIILEGTKGPVKTEVSQDEVRCELPKCPSNMREGLATAYTAPKTARTATGAVPVQGTTIAVNPKIIPYGKKITVKSENGTVLCQGVAQDTGGALRKGNALVDIYMNSKEDCIKFGRKKVKVEW